MYFEVGRSTNGDFSLASSGLVTRWNCALEAASAVAGKANSCPSCCFILLLLLVSSVLDVSVSAKVPRSSFTAPLQADLS